MRALPTLSPRPVHRAEHGFDGGEQALGREPGDGFIWRPVCQSLSMILTRREMASELMSVLTPRAAALNWFGLVFIGG